MTNIRFQHAIVVHIQWLKLHFFVRDKPTTDLASMEDHVNEF